MSIPNPISNLSRRILFGLLLISLLAPALHGQNSNSQSVPGLNTTDSVATFGEGLDGVDNADYEALMKELYGDETKEVKPEIDSALVLKKRERTPVNGPAPGMFKNSGLNGAYFSINIASPYAVSEQLASWYSFIDAGAAIKLPYVVYVESIPLYFLFEVSSFSFENTYPAGGSFAGISYVMQASAIGDQASAALGFGFWDAEMGSMLELSYRFRPTNNTFLRFGTRGVLITDIDLLGPAWWAELRLSMGFEL